MGRRLEIVCIQRRDTIGFVELLRGKYKLGELEYIGSLLASMTVKERERVMTLDFHTLWEDLWGPPLEGTHAYRNEKEISRQKFEALRSMTTPTFQELMERYPSTWTTPEWGFPKGRRDPYESEYTCALREMTEETGIAEKEVTLVKNLDCIQERFVGSNAVEYCHKYFIAFVPSEREVTLDVTNAVMTREVGDIRWVAVDDVEAMLRPEQTQKGEVVKAVKRLVEKYIGADCRPARENTSV